MKPTFPTTLPYLIALTVLITTAYLQCTGQQPPKPADSTQLQQALVRPPRIYGAYTLRWDRYTRGFYRDTITIDTVQFIVEEQAPGILMFEDQWPFSRLPIKKLEYYDTLSHALLKTVDLEALSPYYNGQYPGITTGNIDPESEILPEEPDSDCVFAKLPPPQYYSTYNSISLLNDVGYYLVGNYLIGYRHEGDVEYPSAYVVSWESTVIVLNPQGEELLRIKPDYTFHAALVTTDGRYLCVSYGGRLHATSGSPFEPCAAYFDLYDMQEDKRLMHYLGMNVLRGVFPGTLKRFDNNLISIDFERLGNTDRDETVFEQLIFDPSKREVRIYEIGTGSEYILPGKSPRLMDEKPHKLQKF